MPSNGRSEKKCYVIDQKKYWFSSLPPSACLKIMVMQFLIRQKQTANVKGAYGERFTFRTQGILYNLASQRG